MHHTKIFSVFSVLGVSLILIILMVLIRLFTFLANVSDTIESYADFIVNEDIQRC